MSKQKGVKTDNSLYLIRNSAGQKCSALFYIMKYYYKSVTGEKVKIDVDDKWFSILEGLDKKQNNKARTNRKHEVYCCDDMNLEDIFGQYDENIENLTGIGNDETIKRVQKTLEKMKPKQAELLKLIYFDNVKMTQIAKKEGKTLTAISQRHKTAKRNFIKFWQKP